MTNLEVLYTVQHIAQVFGKNLEMSLEQFNNLLNLSQQELFREFVGGYASGNGAEVDARVSAAIAPFKVMTEYTSSAWTISTNHGLGISCIVFNQGIDVYMPLGAWAYDNAEEYPDKVIKIDIVTASEAVERANNAITYPSDSYPIMFMDKSGGAAQYVTYVIPSTFTKIRVFSINKPTTPTLVETITNGVRTQNVSSVALGFDSIYHVDIIRIILKYLGLSVGSEFIQNFVEQQKVNEK